jgi:histidine triad (HIT) family protein
MSAPAPCIFCEIVAGRVGAAKVAESEHALAFLDLFPVAEGHTLVIPKVHYANLFDADETTLAAVHVLARRVARAQRRALAPDGLMITQLNGAAAGQTVFHYHAHLIPRQEGAPLALHGRRRAEAAELDALAVRIAAALEPA